MLKKFTASFATLVLALSSFAALSIVSIAPAQAGTDKVPICHATSAANGHYNYLWVSKDATADGHIGHQNGRDIIPSYLRYETVDKVTTKYTVPGQNTTKTESQFTEADCAPLVTQEKVVASPTEPEYIAPTCSKPEFPYGRFEIPAKLGEGVLSASVPVLGHNNSTISTTYTLKEDTLRVAYSWADVNGRDKTFTANTTHISSDPLWVVDGATGVGACELSNTGAGKIKSEHILYAGILIFAGLLLTTVVRRRKA